VPAQLQPTLGATNSGPRVGPVVINEIRYHPPPGHDEFVELYNLSAAPVDLSDGTYPTGGWRLNGLAYTFSNTASIPAGGFLLLVGTDPVAFRTKYSVPLGAQVLGSLGRRPAGQRRAPPPRTPRPARHQRRAVHRRGRGPLQRQAAVARQRRRGGAVIAALAPGLYGNEPTNWFASGITPGVTNSFNQAPSVTLVSPTNGAVFQVPANVTLAALASDPDGALIQVEFFAGRSRSAS